MTVRIAMGRISHETHALSPLPTTIEAFERFHLMEGPELRAAIRPWKREVSQPALYNAELSGLWRAAKAARSVELVPLVSAWAIPSGKLDPQTFENLTERLLDSLGRAGTIDGVFLVLHGAMGVVGEPDPEARLLERVREKVGPDVVIAVVYDMHAILTVEKMAPVDLVFGFQTNPHRDHCRIGEIAGEQLIRTIRKKIRPHMVWRSLPMVIGGAPTIDALAPMRPIFKRMRKLERDGTVVSASLFQSQLWHDSPACGWAVTVITDDDPETAESIADELAQALWDVRHHLPEDFGDIDTAIERARAATWRRAMGTICLSDASDMVGCGSVGENTAVLAALLERAQDLRCYVPIRDSVVIADHWETPNGTDISLSIGGKCAPDWYPPLDITGTVVHRADTGLWGRALVLDLGHVTLVVTEHSPMAVSPDFYGRLGLSVLKADICVVKGLFLFRLYYLPYNRLSLFACTGGMTDFDVYERITYDRPVHPKDEVTDWREGDRFRRRLKG